MQNRLSICSQYLKEVEARLIQLQRNPSSDVDDESRISLALSFVRQAMITLVGQTPERVEDLPESTKHLGPRKSKATVPNSSFEINGWRRGYRDFLTMSATVGTSRCDIEYAVRLTLLKACCEGAVVVIGHKCDRAQKGPQTGGIVPLMPTDCNRVTCRASMWL